MKENDRPRLALSFIEPNQVKLIGVLTLEVSFSFIKYESVSVRRLLTRLKSSDSQVKMLLLLKLIMLVFNK